MCGRSTDLDRRPKVWLLALPADCGASQRAFEQIAGPSWLRREIIESSGFTRTRCACKLTQSDKVIVCGAFLLSTGIVFWYVIWGLLAFGFTITLLSSIADHSGPVPESEWVKTYTRGDGLAAFANNRLQLLLNANLIQKDGEVIVLTRRGVCVAWIVRLIRRVQGL